MKKIVFLIALTLIGSVCVAQRGGGGTRSSSRSSVTTRTSTPSRSSVSTPRSTTTYSSSRGSSSRNSSYRPSETRSQRVTTNYTTYNRNSVRTQNNGPYTGQRPNTRPSVSSHGAPVHGTPHHPGTHNHHGYHHPHHPVPHGMHPAPPVYHPIHHHRPIHMHHHIYYDWRVHNLYWYGYWAYVHTHPYEEVVVYVNNTRPSTTVIALMTDENYIYTIYRDELLNETYFTISDKDDNVLVKTIVHKKYCKIVVDENGVWLLKKKDKDPIYFMYQDGNLYRYEED